MAAPLQLCTLNSLAQVVSLTLLVDDLLVDFACGDVVVAVKGHIQETLVVAQVKINLTTIVQDKNFTWYVKNNFLANESSDWIGF